MRCANGTSPDQPQLECLPCAPGYAGRLGFCNLCPQTPHASVPVTASSRFIENPLEPGSLERMDCTRCADSYSDDGVTCKKCPWGWGVNDQQNGCYVCPFGTVSTAGVSCATCPPGYEVNAEIDYEYDTLKQTNGSTECRSCELRGRTRPPALRRGAFFPCKNSLFAFFLSSFGSLVFFLGVQSLTF